MAVAASATLGSPRYVCIVGYGGRKYVSEVQGREMYTTRACLPRWQLDDMIW